jgi:hypothetical protein
LSTIDLYKFEELETSLLIQKDENDALKAALKSTLEAKEEGLFYFSKIIKTMDIKKILKYRFKIVCRNVGINKARLSRWTKTIQANGYRR